MVYKWYLVWQQPSFVPNTMGHTEIVCAFSLGQTDQCACCSCKCTDCNHKATFYLIVSETKLYCDVIIGAMAPQIAILTIVYATVHSGINKRKHQSSVSLAFVREIHRWPVNSPHKWPVTRKMIPFDDIIRNMQSWNIFKSQTDNFCYLWMDPSST